jgi:predicted RNase H-like HicB family nuclease
MRPEEYLKNPYARILIPEEEGFSAEILEFPGCFAVGRTADEAFKNLECAAISWIEAALSQGQEIPSPSMSQGYGGRIALRLPKGIHRRASELAQRENISLNQFILSAVAAKIGAEDGAAPVFLDTNLW